MAVVEPIEAAWHELRTAPDELWIHATPGDGVWEARIAQGRPVIRVRIRDRCWELGLFGAWSGGRKAAYKKIASGEATGELFLYRVPRDETQHGNGSASDLRAYSKIMCRIVAWLPQVALPVPAGQLGPSTRPLGEVDIRDLREAIRANRVSFPSQVPTFTEYDRPDLQRKLAQLYFVLGWNCNNIGARYGLSAGRVQEILNTWKRRAVKADPS